MRFSIVAAAVLVTANAMASATVREMHVTPLSTTHDEIQVPREQRIAVEGVTTNATTEASRMSVMPVAGLVNIDHAIPYFVDLDPSAGIRDFNCTRLTYDGHTGHDPYIRSFAEQRIGVPVFAVRDGVVVDVHDGEPDEHTVADPSFRANYVYLRHGTDERSLYIHLRRDSIPVKIGDFVPAGTQIGLVGSSGPSRAPHIHFETTLNGTPVEPLAGPCRAGGSILPHQERLPDVDQPIVFGASFSNESFAGFRSAPYDEAPHTGTFNAGPRTIYFRAEFANVRASTAYQLTLDPPGAAGEMIAAAGTLVNYDASLFSVWWGIQVDLNRVGTWNLKVKVDGQQLLVAPFTVIGVGSPVVNRPPSAYNVSFEAPVIVPGAVPVCRVDGQLFPDPDYDVVSYRYRWTVGEDVVRDVTTAARTDALARDRVRAGSTLRCSVTASDGKVETQAVSAFATVNAPRRRAVKK